MSLFEGKKVTGSDSCGSALIDDLRLSGAVIFDGHKAENLDEDTELVVYTEAIDKTFNPEFLRAHELQIPVLSYFQALGEVSQVKKTIAVVGTHGKTTTTAMLGLALIRAGLEPTVVVGSKVKEFQGRNVRIGKGDVFVTEACEYRKSFLSLFPFGAVFLNCEAEHLDYYGNEANYIAAYSDLMRKIPSDGFVVANMDDRNAREAVKHCAGKVIPVKADDLKSFDLNISVPGGFNRFNALFAYRTGIELGADRADLKAGLEDFKGTWRRLEERGGFNGALVIDDYGHHPTEIKLTLSAIREKYDSRRILCVFQAHQYSRTFLLLDDFKGAFTDADKVFITDIYKVRDSVEDVSRIDGKRFAESIAEKHPDTFFSGSLDDTYEILKDEVKEGDVLVIMGAGNIENLAERII